MLSWCNIILYLIQNYDQEILASTFPTTGVMVNLVEGISQLSQYMKSEISAVKLRGKKLFMQKLDFCNLIVNILIEENECLNRTIEQIRQELSDTSFLDDSRDQFKIALTLAKKLQSFQMNGNCVNDGTYTKAINTSQITN